ncbi:MAG: hypothetical protein ACFE95_16885 [Candidatus Hodarchaeota archaeon]
MNKNKQIKKQILLGTMIIFLLGVLIFNSPLQGIAVLTQDQQPPIDNPQPGVPFEIPNDGTPVELTPGEGLILETPAGVTIELMVGESVTISIIESTDLPAEAGTLPENAYGIGKYLSIELDNSEVEVDAIISMPYSEGELPEGVAEEQLYFAFYEAATGEWRGVPSWVDTANGIVYGSTGHFSTWTVISTPDGPPFDIPQPGKPFEIPGNGSSVYLIPGERLILETPAGVSISLTVGESVNISVKETDVNPAGVLPGNASSLGKYLEIELDDPDVAVEATLGMPYTDGEIPEGVAEEQLYFAFYDAATGEWRGVPSWVDTVNNMVYANTTHFSTWTVLGSTDSSTILPQLWLIINNVKDGFLISFTVLSLFLAAVALISRRQK